MARFLKNPDLTRSGKLAARLPMVPNGSYGDAPVDGLIRYRQDASRIEFYYNGAWSQVAKIGNVTINVDIPTGTQDGVNNFFTMNQAETDPNAIIVTIGGVYQQPGTHYTVTGTTLTFITAPPPPGVNPNQIVVIHNLNSTNAA